MPRAANPWYRSGRVHTLEVPAVSRRQEVYIGEVVDAVDDLDNVLYEIASFHSGSEPDFAWTLCVRRIGFPSTTQRPISGVCNKLDRCSVLWGSMKTVENTLEQLQCRLNGQSFTLA